MPYPVYLLRTLGAPRDHHCIFVALESDDSGFIFQVSGNIQTGMEFNHRHSETPEKAIDFLSKSYLGTVSTDVYDIGRMKEVIQTVLPPKKQFDGAKRIEPGTKLKRCQEWVAEVVEVLKEGGVLER